MMSNKVAVTIAVAAVCVVCVVVLQTHAGPSGNEAAPEGRFHVSAGPTTVLHDSVSGQTWVLTSGKRDSVWIPVKRLTLEEALKWRAHELAR